MELVEAWWKLVVSRQSLVVSWFIQLVGSWWIETGVEPLVAVLGEAMALSDEERAEMGERGRRLV